MGSCIDKRVKAVLRERQDAAIDERFLAALGMTECGSGAIVRTWGAACWTLTRIRRPLHRPAKGR